MPNRQLITVLFAAAVFAGALWDSPRIANAQEAIAQNSIEKQSLWHGFERLDFEVDSRACILVKPKKAAENRPWIWRARFFGHEPQADIALLQHGFHIAYCDVAGLFGSPKAVAHWNQFYDVATKRFQLNSRPALEGMSRGGLIIYGWAAANPKKVACIYGDAPVCDFKSWPGGRGMGKGGGRAWEQCLKAYGISESEADAYPLNPIDNLVQIAKADVPILHVVGDADEVVPVAENTSIVELRYREMGGSIKVIHKPGVGHHPHSLKDPAPIVAFVLEHTRPNVQLRGSLANSLHCFAGQKKGHVAFIGGSITEMDGYRPMVCNDLKARFPSTQFTFTDAGIASTCSTTGAFRLGDDVLSKGPVDLFFVEFAVNDDQDAGHSFENCVRGLEGIVRGVRKHNPNCDIVITYFVNPGMLSMLQNGKTPVSIGAHSAVAEHYQVSTIHLAKEIAEQCASKKITWKEFGGTHPKPFGNRICADLISQLLDSAWDAEEQPVVKAHDTDIAPLDLKNYENGRFVDPEVAMTGRGWHLGIPDWDSLPGSKRSRFTSIPMLCAEEPGATLTLQFTGTAVGAYIVAGPDAGSVEVTVDGGEKITIDLMHRFSKGLHYPRTVVFANELSPEDHTLELTVGKDSKSGSHAVRIIKFVAN